VPLQREFPPPTDGHRVLLRSDQLARFHASYVKLVINEEYGECWVWMKETDRTKGDYGRFYLGKAERDDGKLVSVRRTDP
jgi:hypothetical protein